MAGVPSLHVDGGWGLARIAEVARQSRKRLAGRATRPHAARGTQRTLGHSKLQPPFPLLRRCHDFFVLPGSGFRTLALDWEQERCQVSARTGTAWSAVEGQVYRSVWRWLLRLSDTFQARQSESGVERLRRCHCLRRWPRGRSADLDLRRASVRICCQTSYVRNVVVYGRPRIGAPFVPRSGGVKEAFQRSLLDARQELLRPWIGCETPAN